MMLFTDLVYTKTPYVYRLLLWAPEIFQLATFSLLVAFLGSIVFPRSSRRAIFVVYGVLNGSFLVFHVLIYSLIVSKSVTVPEFTEAVADAFCFFALSASLCWVGVRLLRLLGDPLRGPPAQAKLGRKSSKAKIAVFVVYVVLVLLSRAIVDLLLALKIVAFSNFSSLGGFTWQVGGWFLGYTMWEVIPILIFIIIYWPTNTFADMPTSAQITSGLSVNAIMEDMGQQKPISIREAEPLLSSNLFTNPARYDSDGEEAAHPFETASGSLYSPYFTNSPQLAGHGLKPKNGAAVAAAAAAAAAAATTPTPGGGGGGSITASNINPGNDL